MKINIEKEYIESKLKRILRKQPGSLLRSMVELNQYGHLTFRELHISLEQACELAIFIENSQEISELTFVNSVINEQGMDVITMALQKNKFITSLSLEYCEIKKISILVSMLANNTTLKRLSYLEKAELQSCSEELLGTTQASKIECLNLGPITIDNNIEKFASELNKKNTISTLGLRGTFTHNGLLILLKALKENKTLTNIWLRISPTRGTKVDEALIVEMHKLFKENYRIKNLLIDEMRWQRTSTEIDFQTTLHTTGRCAPAYNVNGIATSLGTLKKVIQMRENSVVINNYLKAFKDKEDQYLLSWFDLFRLLEIILQTVQEEVLFITNKVLCELFLTSHFLKVYFHLHKLTVIHRDNFKIFYLLSEEHLIGLHIMFTNQDETLHSTQIALMNPFFSTHSMTVFHAFNENKAISLLKRDLMMLITLSENDINRLFEIVKNLEKKGLLTRDTFELALSRINTKISGLSKATVIKHSRKIKENALEQSQFHLTNSGRSLRFFIEHAREYPGGGSGRVKKGYPLEPEQKLYSVKIYLACNEAGEKAKKNAKYQAYYGRESWFYKRNGRYTAVYQWQGGKPLYQCQPEDIIAVPFINRFYCILHGLSQLEILHKQLRIHNDLYLGHIGNVIADFEQCTLALIDFDQVRKGVDEDFQNEVNAMGTIFKHLFPELFSKKINEIALTPKEYAIIKLISSMTDKNPRQRCTIENALIFCQKLSQKLNQFNPESLTHASIDALAHETILQNILSFEDVLRGKTEVRIS